MVLKQSSLLCINAFTKQSCQLWCRLRDAKVLSEARDNREGLLSKADIVYQLATLQAVALLLGDQALPSTTPPACAIAEG